MNKKKLTTMTVLFIVSIAMIVIFQLWWWRAAPKTIVYRKEIRECDQVIKKIEDYIASFGKLPEESNYDLIGTFCSYQSYSGDYYIVGFSTGMESGGVFDSRKKKWNLF